MFAFFSHIAVHDANALLVDNAAESGEESEDEWNYYKGDDATNKENIQTTDPDEEVTIIIVYYNCEMQKNSALYYN